MTELKQQLQEATVKANHTPPPAVMPAATQTEGGREEGGRESSSDGGRHHVREGGSQWTGSPSQHQSDGHRALSEMDHQVCSQSALLCGTVEVQKAEVM